MAKFLVQEDRDKVLHSKAKLKGTHIWVEKDFPIEIIRFREELWCQAELFLGRLGNGSRGTRRAVLRFDKPISDGIAYTLDWNGALVRVDGGDINNDRSGGGRGRGRSVGNSRMDGTQSSYGGWGKMAWGSAS